MERDFTEFEDLDACTLCGVTAGAHEDICPRHPSRAAAAEARTILRTTIAGTPVQWARARIGGKGKAGGQDVQAAFHTAPAQKRYKNLVKDEANFAMLRARARAPREHSGPRFAPLGTPVIFEALVFLPIPSSFTKADQLLARTGQLRPTAVPDLDNWLKLPMDGCKGIAYADDSQVVGFGRSGKWYADKPRLELHIYHAPPGLPLDRDALDMALRNLRALVAPWSLMNPLTSEHDPISGADLVDQLRTALGLGLIR